MKDILGKELLKQCVVVMQENTSRIIRCLDEVDERDIWVSPNEHRNTIAT